jgi:glutathione S-transferase
MSTPVLWHFPISHCNEKARWALDLKGVAHRRVALGASYLVRAWWATGTPKLPVLHFSDETVGDSTRIIAALEERVPDPPLYPTDPNERARARALEDYFDQVVGDPVRSFLIGNLVRHDPREAIAAIGTGMPHVARMANAIRPLFRAFYYWRHAIDDSAIDAAPRIIEDSFERIERELAGREYLVGDRFSVADLTAASILGPLVRPPELEYPPDVAMPDVIEALRTSLAKRPSTRVRPPTGWRSAHAAARLSPIPPRTQPGSRSQRDSWTTIRGCGRTSTSSSNARAAGTRSRTHSPSSRSPI